MSAATTTRFQEGLARAYHVPLTLIGTYLSGSIDLDELLLQAGTNGDGYTKYGNIEAAFAYHGNRWHPVAEAAGRALALCRAPHDPSPQEWATDLDRIEELLIASGLLPDAKK